MKIRKATQNDSEAVFALLDQFDREPDPRPSNSTVERIFTTFEDCADGVFVAEIDGAVVGTFQIAVCPQLNHSGRPFGVVENVIVDSSCRRKGIGKIMMKEAKRIAEDAGCSKLFLISGKQRPYNHRFYESCGFAGNKIGFQVRFGV